MSLDPELKAMTTVLEALVAVKEQEAQVRVIEWVCKKLGLVNAPTQGGRSSGHVDIQSRKTATGLSAFESIADLFAEVHVKTDVLRVLLAAAFLQEKNEKSELMSREINQELTNLGHPSSNITRDLGVLMSKKPKLIIQTRKEGTTKQAQKKYKVTTEGFKFVQTLIDGPKDEE